ncbi:MAG TPA: PQQ-binding-like beta-propeller repeat protein, partial [Tepidisphaeraceae bacterium]|nr:PQQ-binding-like beta-propeller repeat protein [Tepidisphaeraceae bacterium]
MTIKKLLVTAALAASPVLLIAQGRGLDPAKLLKPLADEWPTYSGDYTAKRYSLLTQINRLNVKHLTLAWTLRLNAGSANGPGGGGFGGGRGGGGATNFNVGGEGNGDYPAGGPPTIKASALMVDGTIYMTAPDNAWAIDARDGRVLWQYFWKSRGGTHIATRGFGMWKDYLYMETPDNYLVSLDAKTGKERWHKVIADFNEQYFSTAAPVVIGNHVIAGTGNDLDMPGFLQSFDPETGELQWKLYTVPMNPGDPGVETWPSL